MLSRTRARSFLRKLIGRSDLDSVIRPEIVDDPFAQLIRTAASDPAVRTVLEIGSSDGRGSTAAIVDGLRTKHSPVLVCLEVSAPRFRELQARYADLDWVSCLRESSVPVSSFVSAADVEDFLARCGEQIYGVPPKEVLRWLAQDIEYVTDHHLPDTGIDHAKEIASVDHFDMVLIDGSEFSGVAELDRLIGAGYVLLDDVRTLKNANNVARLESDPRYVLVEKNLELRNGYAAFRRRDFA